MIYGILLGFILIERMKKMDYRLLKYLYSGVVNETIEKLKKYHASDSLILAMIKQESGGNIFALGRIGEIGLMQLSVPAITDYNVAHSRQVTPFGLYLNPQLNIEIGVWYLNWLFDQFNDEALAVTAYNRGIGNVRRHSYTLEYYNSVKQHQIQIERA